MGRRLGPDARRIASARAFKLWCVAGGVRARDLVAMLGVSERRAAQLRSGTYCPWPYELARLDPDDVAAYLAGVAIELREL